jgi:hypothetical protein
VNFDITGSYESKKWLRKSNVITQNIRYAKIRLSLPLGVTTARFNLKKEGTDIHTLLHLCFLARDTLHVKKKPEPIRISTNQTAFNLRWMLVLLTPVYASVFDSLQSARYSSTNSIKNICNILVSRTPNAQTGWNTPYRLSPTND